MRISVTPDHDFNMELFADLCRKAIGSSTQKQFSSDTGLSPTLINRCLNKKLPANPSPSTIATIAGCSEGRVSFAELLDAAGYNPNDFDESFIQKAVSAKRKSKGVEVFSDLNNTPTDANTFQSRHDRYVEKRHRLIDQTDCLVRKVAENLNKMGYSFSFGKEEQNSFSISGKQDQPQDYCTFKLEFDTDDYNMAKESDNLLDQWIFYPVIVENRLSPDITNLLRNISKQYFEKNDRFLLSIVVNDERAARELSPYLKAYKFWCEIIVLKQGDYISDIRIAKRMRTSYPSILNEKAYHPAKDKTYTPLKPYSKFDFETDEDL